MILRQYQGELVSAVARGFNEGFMRQLAVLPTGGGKTICFSNIASRFWTKRSERSLILAHREELVEQAADKLQRSTGLQATIEQGDRHADRESPVVVASVQTMQRGRLESWDKNHFGLVIVDEAHHILAKTFRNAVEHFDSRMLGVTATPDRGDRKNLATFFDNLAYEIGILELTKQKYLAPLRIRSMPLQIDINEVKSSGGDLDAGQLDSAITPYLGAIARAIRDHCQDRKRIVVFCPLVKTSLRFVDECQAIGIHAMHVDGQSSNRAETLKHFGSPGGDQRVLSNVMLLTEGYDEPAIDCVIVLRPTKSRSLFSQMIGRGLRLHDGKENCLFFDFLWLHEKHNLAKPACLVAKNKEEEEQITKSLEKGEKDLEEAVEDAAHEREAALIRQIAENARRRERFITLEEVGAILKDRKIQDYEPVFGWENQRPSPKQLQVLERFGLKCQTKGEASIIMDRLFSRSKSKLATPKQLQWLVRYNHPSPETVTAKEAKAFLEAKWAKNT